MDDKEEFIEAVEQRTLPQAAGLSNEYLVITGYRYFDPRIEVG